jgi:hypothetical protein
VDNLYVFAGVPYIVSNAASDIIDVHDIVSPGCKSPDHSSACITSSEALKIVSLEEARQIFGRFVHKVPGVTVSVDPWVVLLILPSWLFLCLFSLFPLRALYVSDHRAI